MKINHPHLGRRETKRNSFPQSVYHCNDIGCQTTISVYFCSVWQGETYRTTMMQKVSFGPTFWWMFTSELWVDFGGIWWNISLFQLLLGFVHLIPQNLMEHFPISTLAWVCSFDPKKIDGTFPYFNSCLGLFIWSHILWRMFTRCDYEPWVHFFWQTSGNISYLNYCWFEVWTCHNRYHQAGSLFELHELVANDPWPQYGWYGDDHKNWLVMQINLE